MKTLFTILTFSLSIVGSVLAEEKRIAAPFSIYKTVDAPELAPTEAEYIFEFQNLDMEDKNATITLQMDSGDNEKLKLQKGRLVYKTTPGSHKFIVYINENYFELYSHELIIKAQTRQYYYVYPQSTEGLQIEVDKPVIYLYPEEKQRFELTVHPKGDLRFTYPTYNSNWTGVAHPDGSIDVNQEKFRYLFWESKQEMNALNPGTTAGYVVERNELLSFLEEKLNHVGFTPSERADFLTFWVPQMQKHDQVFVTFPQNENCNQFATMECKPQPDNINRFYMSWGAYEGKEIPKPQILSPMNREGFTLLEWGGQEIPTINKTIEL